MFYKVMKDDRVIDVLDNIVYLKWQDKHKTMILTDENDAQAILSSDKETIWHEKTLYNIPVEAGFYDSVSLEVIDEFEFKQLKALNMKTPEAIIDAFLLGLIEDNIL